MVKVLQEQNRNMEGFKMTIKAYISTQPNAKSDPQVVIIEQKKHLFGVPNVVKTGGMIRKLVARIALLLLKLNGEKKMVPARIAKNQRRLQVECDFDV